MAIDLRFKTRVDNLSNFCMVSKESWIYCSEIEV